MRRGDIFAFRPIAPGGHEQRGQHYAVIVQSDAFLPRSTVLVAPTSTSARAASFRPEIEFGDQTTRVLVEQTAAIESGRLGDFVGVLDAAERWAVDEALAVVLDLN